MAKPPSPEDRNVTCIPDRNVTDQKLIPKALAAYSGEICTMSRTIAIALAASAVLTAQATAEVRLEPAFPAGTARPDVRLR